MKKVEELQKHRAATERAATSRMLIEGVAFFRGARRGNSQSGTKTGGAR